MPFHGDDSASFDNFNPGNNHECVEAVKAASMCKQRSVVYVHGGPSGGKTHLLVAAYRQNMTLGRGAVYLPLGAPWLVPDSISGLNASGAVFADDIDMVGGRPEIAEPLLSLWERSKNNGGCWVSAAKTPPAAVAGLLPDLASRLAASTVYQLEPLSDGQRVDVLHNRARARGLELTGPVIRYALSHYSRDLGVLLDWLAEVDRASMQHQRRITIPFLKQVGLGPDSFGRNPSR